MSGWRNRLAAALLVGAVAILPSRSSAQERQIDPETTVRVSIGRTTAQPDSTPMLPIYFTPPETKAVGNVTLQVTYVSANVKFDRLEPGPAADSGSVKLGAEVKAGKNENGVATETVTITAAAPPQSPAGIPGGLLAYLTLRASPEARPAKIALRSAASATAPGSSSPLPDVQSFDGELEMQAPGTELRVVCFFFTH
jgi:hypothetical protein